jgi:Tetratricopeptide repeat
MKKNFYLLISLYFLMTSSSEAQITIKEGFDLIDQQKFTQAFIFFNNYLHEHPKDKSACIGYGRALGLKGNAKEAYIFFDSLLIIYPHDLEIELNWAESILWKKEASIGEKAYRNLTKTYPKNYVAYIGLGNALSMQQRYTEALEQYYFAKKLNPTLDYINILLKNGMTNQAYKLYTQAKYEESKLFYKKVLLQDSLDSEALNGIASVFLVQDSLKQTKKIYTKLSKIKGQEVKATVMLGYTSKLEGNYNDALLLNQKAFRMTYPEDTALYLLASTNLLYAYLWNQKINTANTWLKQLEYKYPKRLELTIPKAQLYVFQSRQRKSAAILNSVLQKDSTSFDANLGLADIYLGLGNYLKANQYMKKTLALYPNQPDVLFVKHKLNKALAPQNNFKWNYFKDSNKNFSNQYSYYFSTPLSWQSKAAFEYNYLTIGVKNSPQTTIMNNFIGSYSINPKNGWQLLFQGNYNQIIEKNKYHNLLYKIRTSHQIEGGHYIEITFNKDIFYYTSVLLQKNITTQNIGLVYNGKIYNTVGIYSNIQKTSFSDQNKRNSAYVSIYVNAPIKNLKSGISALYINYALQVPIIYYSPLKMTSLEYFIQYNNFLLEEKKWQFSAEIAAGILKEINQKQQFTYRLTGFTAYNFEDNNQFYIKGIFGNSSQLQLNLYSISLLEIGLKIAPEEFVFNKYK